MKDKVVVCGGGGFVGFNLIPKLKKEYKNIVLIDKHKKIQIIYNLCIL